MVPTFRIMIVPYLENSATFAARRMARGLCREENDVPLLATTARTYDPVARLLFARNWS